MKKTLACFLALVLMLGMINLSLAAEDPLGKFDPPITITYARNANINPKFAPDQDYEHNIWMTEYDEVLGINVDTIWTAEGVEAYDMQLNLRIANGDIPDMFVCNAAQFQLLVEADMLEDLTDVFEAYQSDLVRDNFTADEGKGLGMATVGGKLYGIPDSAVTAGKFHFVFLREDWRLALGLPVPETLSDLVAIADAFTNQDPDGNGVKDTYGFAISNEPFETYFSVPGWFNSFGAFPEQWIMKDGEVVHGSIQPEMKTALAALRDWVEQGLIDPEFKVKGSWPVSEDAVAGKSGIASAEWWLLSWPLPDAFKNGHDWRAYPILYDESAPVQKVGGTATLGNRYVVRKGYEHPEALVKMYNLFQERVMSMNYDIRIYKGDDEFSYEGLTAVYAVVGHDRNMRNHMVVSEAVDKRDPSMLENVDQEKLYKDIVNFIENMDALNIDEQATAWGGHAGSYGPTSVYGRLKYLEDNGMFNVDPFYGAATPAMQSYAGQLKSNTAEMILMIMTGEKPIDYFDEFVANWKALGGDEMTEEVNAWYQAQQ